MLKQPRQKLEKLKQLLMRQQKNVEEELERVKKEDPIISNDALAETREPGTDSWMSEIHTKALVVRGNLSQMLVRIRKSLTNLKLGKYGKCESCGKDIEIQRLEAMPTATLCVACSKKKK